MSTMHTFNIYSQICELYVFWEKNETNKEVLALLKRCLFSPSVCQDYSEQFFAAKFLTLNDDDADIFDRSWLTLRRTIRFA